MNEDVVPIEHGDFPAIVILVFGGVFFTLELQTNISPKNWWLE